MRSKFWLVFAIAAACATSPNSVVPPVPPPAPCVPRRYLIEFTIPDPTGMIYGHDPIPEDAGARDAAPVKQLTAPTVTIEEITGDD
jgi:hypothetical protein